MSANTDNLKGEPVAAAPTVEVLPGDAQNAAHRIVDNAHEQTGAEHDKPIWYLAYGSNLNSKVFTGQRGITPLEKRNVFVPGLELTFNLGGLPFVEPRFANARFVTDPARTQEVLKDGKAYYDWEEPWTGRGALLGVAYLVTPTDFGTILATEGGGGSYKMISVEAFALACDAHPGKDGGKPHALTGDTLKAYTLVASASTRNVEGNASLRYLNLIRTGAEEQSLPLTYRTYLEELRPYSANTLGRKIARFIIQLTFYPTLMTMFTCAKFVAKSDGTYPGWLMTVQVGIFQTMWFVHDWVLKPFIGDGETASSSKDEGKERTL